MSTIFSHVNYKLDAYFPIRWTPLEIVHSGIPFDTMFPFSGLSVLPRFTPFDKIHIWLNDFARMLMLVEFSAWKSLLFAIR